MSVQPIFLLSIARTGSTLVQRVLGAYPEVSTVSEPWLLLPPVYARRERGIAAEYWQPHLADALEDFAGSLPGGEAAYDAEVRRFALNLYAQAAEPGSRYFLDKTPPYFHIADDLFRLFPDARFVFLWRNPLSVLASLIDWEQGRWRPTFFRENLFDGIAKLVRTYEAHRDEVLSLRYEDLLVGEDPWRALAEHLDLTFDPKTLSRFARVELAGRMGDPTGVNRYSALSTEPLTKWRSALGNPLRREWARRYVLWIGRERLATMGYDIDVLLSDLAELPVSRDGLAGDAKRALKDLAMEPVKARARARFGIGGPSAFRYLLDG